jgi:hypothetical protein
LGVLEIINNLGDLDINGSTGRMDLKEIYFENELDSSGCCGNGNEFPGSINGLRFHDQLSDHEFLKDYFPRT